MDASDWLPPNSYMLRGVERQIDGWQQHRTTKRNSRSTKGSNVSGLFRPRLHRHALHIASMVLARLHAQHSYNQSLPQKHQKTYLAVKHTAQRCSYLTSIKPYSLHSRGQVLRVTQMNWDSSQKRSLVPKSGPPQLVVLVSKSTATKKGQQSINKFWQALQSQI